ncbi:MAG: phage holin family protein, partial [Raoultibacter sp.]
LFGLILALINQTIRPILHLLSLPISCLTLGIFALVVNTAMLYLAQWIANGIFQVGFIIDTFGSAFVASIVISIVSAILNSVTGANKE